LGHERRLARVDRCHQRGHAVHVTVCSSQDRRPTRRAQRVGGETVLEQHSALRNLVYAWSLVHNRSVCPDRMRSVVVGENHDDIGATFVGHANYSFSAGDEVWSLLVGWGSTPTESAHMCHSAASASTTVGHSLARSCNSVRSATMS